MASDFITHALQQYVNLLAALTSHEVEFLKSYGFDENSVYDARGISRKRARKNAKLLDKPILLGSPCTQGGHRLKTRSGHCLECDPSKITYQTRHSSKGSLYIAASPSSGLIKVGMSNNLNQREKSLQREYYAECGDWQILASIALIEAGRAESDIKNALKPYQAHGLFYEKNGLAQESTEVYEICFEPCMKIISKILMDLGLGNEDLEFDWYLPSQEIFKVFP